MRKYGLDAFHPIHVPLPRAVAPYLTVRTVKAFSSADALLLFGPMRTNQTGGVVTPTGPTWNDSICASVSAANLTNAMNSASWDFTSIPIPGSETAGFLECVPAAFSVQIMNDTALQSADGVFYAGRMKGNIHNPDASDIRPINQLADSLVSYAPPRILTGSKLSLGAVQINALPGDMTELAEFTPIHRLTPGGAPGIFTGRNRYFSGFNPTYLYNPEGKTLQFLVAVEWRVRVSPFNPLASSVTSHPPTSDTLWSDIIDGASKLGHGVMDVVEYLEGML
jgi:hypothetical protein